MEQTLSSARCALLPGQFCYFLIGNIVGDDGGVFTFPFFLREQQLLFLDSIIADFVSAPTRFIRVNPRIIALSGLAERLALNVFELDIGVTRHQNHG